MKLDAVVSILNFHNFTTMQGEWFSKGRWGFLASHERAVFSSSLKVVLFDKRDKKIFIEATPSCTITIKL